MGYSKCIISPISEIAADTMTTMSVQDYAPLIAVGSQSST